MENKINSNPVSDEQPESNQNENAEIIQEKNEEIQVVDNTTEIVTHDADTECVDSEESPTPITDIIAVEKESVLVEESTSTSEEKIIELENNPNTGIAEIQIEEVGHIVETLNQASEKQNEVSIEHMIGEIDNSSEELPEEDEEIIDELDEKIVIINLDGIEDKTTFELVDLFEDMLNKYDIQTIKSNISTIRNLFRDKINAEKQVALEAYLATGGEKDDYNPEEIEIEIKFNQLLKIYKEKKFEHIEKLESQKNENLKIKEQLLEELKILIESTEPLKIINDKFREIDEQWKLVGPVPQKDYSGLWKSYHFSVERFFDKVRMYRELKDLDLKKNLELKMEICEKAEELLVEKSVAKSFKQLQKFHDQWKEIGPVPEDKKDEIWERFKTCTDRINERRREHYEEFQAELQTNYKAKIVLCESIEELCGKEYALIKEWNEVSDKLTDLLKVWKTIGPAPKEVNDQVWERFKSNLDIFFANKKNYLQKIKDEQLENYNKKVSLCIQAESMIERNDWNKATAELIELQNQWKSIGVVSRKQSDVIWKRFRGACDKFFEKKSHYFAHAKEHEQENLSKKEALIQSIINFEYSESRNEDFEKLKLYQREWSEIGHVPMKEKERLYKEYKTALDNHFDKLKTNSNDARKSNYKSRIDSIMDSPNADRVIDKECRFLQNKASQLKEDILLWENNIGFFVKSKNAQLLTAEFQKKIDDAREELKDIETKLKLLLEKR